MTKRGAREAAIQRPHNEVEEPTGRSGRSAGAALSIKKNPTSHVICSLLRIRNSNAKTTPRPHITTQPPTDKVHTA